MSRVLLRSETPLFAPFIYQLHHFTKTGSGQTGKTQKRVAFRIAPISSPIKKAREGRTGTERCGNRLLCACFTKKPVIYQDRLRTNYIGQVEKQGVFLQALSPDQRLGGVQSWRKGAFVVVQGAGAASVFWFLRAAVLLKNEMV